MNIWTGCSGGLNGWEIGNNWHTGSAPAPGQDVFIFNVNTSLYAYPILSSPSPPIRSLHIGEGSLINHPSLTIASGSGLSIDGTHGLFEMSGIRIEEDGILDIQPEAELLVQNTRAYGLDVYGGTVFNAGTILLDQTDSSGILLVAGIIENMHSGNLHIPRSDASGIAMKLDQLGIDEPTYFTNSGVIEIDTMKKGLDIKDNHCYFTNAGGAKLSIDSCSLVGILNEGIIENEDCGTLAIGGRIQNGGKFNNWGLLIENSAGVSSIDTNNGVVMDFQFVLSNFSIGLNNGTYYINHQSRDLYDLSVWNGCSGGLVDWTYGENWHTGIEPQFGQDVFVFALNTSLYAYPVLTSNSNIIRSLYLGEGIPANQPSLIVTTDGYLTVDGAGAPVLTDGVEVFTDARLLVEEGGIVMVYNSAGNGILNRQGGVYNAGHIETINTNRHGINVYDGPLTNTITGTLNILDGLNSGIYADLSGFVINRGMISIHNNQRGIENGGEIINDSTGHIYVSSGTLEAIKNWGAPFTNQTCGNITVQGKILDLGYSKNYGLLVENSPDTSNIYVNNGIIMNFNSGIFQADTNNWVLDNFMYSELDYNLAVWSGCADTTDWKYDKNWYLDNKPMPGQDVFIYPVPHSPYNDPILNDTSNIVRSVYIGYWVSGVHGVTFIVRDSALLSIDGFGAPPGTDGIYAGESASIFVNTDGKIRILNAQDVGLSNSGIIDNQSIIEIENCLWG
jgi:hypothetical protein